MDTVDTVAWAGLGRWGRMDRVGYTCRVGWAEGFGFPNASEPHHRHTPKVYERYVLKLYPKDRFWKGWDHFSNAKAFLSKTQQVQLWIPLQNLIENDVDMADSSVQNDVITKVLLELFNRILAKEFREVHSQRMLNMVRQPFQLPIGPIVLLVPIGPIESV